ncbi:MAG: flagellar biosynthetic protein FliO [Pseudomonadota bacterium]|nr:flagellar biosynthetic protein FliO [Pseudomonadota bacterium]
MSLASGASSLFWFVAVIALIPVSMWLLKRTPLGGAGGGDGLLRHVAVLPLSGHQRIVTVEVGQGDDKRWLVLGVTASSISTLHTMAPVPLATKAAPSAPLPPVFAKLLARMQRASGGG